MSWIPLKPRAEDAAFQQELQTHPERELSGKLRVSCPECSFDRIEDTLREAQSQARRHKIFTFHDGVKVEEL